MFFHISNLYNALFEYKKIIIYGAGVYAKEAYEKLCKLGWKEKIQCFAVSRCDNSEYIDGLGVCQIDNIQINDMDTAILISVSQSYEDEIVGILKHLNFQSSIYRISEFIETNERREDILANTVGDELIDNIIEWSLSENPAGIYRKSEISRFISSKFEQHTRKEKNCKQIVFVIGNYGPRIVKCISALKLKSKFEITVIAFADSSQNAGRNELRKLGYEIHECKGIEDALYRMLDFKPALFYIEPQWGRCLLPALIIRNKSIYGKIVLALYDVLNDGYFKVDPKQMELERYSLENADGIVWRWYSKDDLIERKGFKYRGKAIQFLDFCGNYHLDKEIDHSDRPKENQVRICFVANRPNWVIKARNEECEYVVEARLEEILKTIGNRKDCVFHLYSWWVNDEEKKELEYLESKYNNFKFFLHIEHEQLIQRISKYDYGSMFYTGGRTLPQESTIDGIHTGGCYKNSSTNRYFDYLDAELPIIATRPEKFCEYLEKYQVVIKMDVGNIDIPQLIRDKAFYKEKARIAKTELSIYNQIPKLTQFIDSVISSEPIEIS